VDKQTNQTKPNSHKSSDVFVFMALGTLALELSTDFRFNAQLTRHLLIFNAFVYF